MKEVVKLILMIGIVGGGLGYVLTQNQKLATEVGYEEAQKVFDRADLVSKFGLHPACVGQKVMGHDYGRFSIGSHSIWFFTGDSTKCSLLLNVVLRNRTKNELKDVRVLGPSPKDEKPVILKNFDE